MQVVMALRGAAGLVAVGLLGVVVAGTNTRLRYDLPPIDAAGEVVYLPDARLLRPLVLGYDNVLADVLWFRTISYFGGHFETDRAYPWLARMCDVVTDLDPHAEHVYRFAGLILPWEANEVDEGLRLLEKGVRNLPDSWLLRYYLGMGRYFFKSDATAAAADLAEASRLPGAPPIVGRLAALMHARQANPETTIAFLRELYRNTDSEQMRQVIGRSLEDAEFRAEAARLERASATYRERFGTAPPAPSVLVEAGLVPTLPLDPYGGAWEIDPATGTVRSSTGRVPRELHQSASAQRHLNAAASTPTER